VRTRLCAVVTVLTAALTLGVGVPSASASTRAKAPQDAPAKKKRKPKATTTTKAVKSASLPSDACKLLTLQEVTPLVTGSNEGAPVNNGQANEVACGWETETTLQDIAVTVTNLPSSIPTAQLKAGLAAEAKDPGHKVVSGLGDYALVGSVIPPNAEVKVLSGHLLLSVEYSSDDPLGSTKQDDVVALAKLAFGRL
jgi:hypothetical protein